MRNWIIASVVVLAVGCGKESADKASSDKAGADKTAATAGKKAGNDSIKDKVEREVKRVAPGAVGGGAASEFGVDSAKIVFTERGAETGTTTAWITGGGSTVVLVRDLSKPEEKVQHIVWKDNKTSMWKEGDKKAYTTKIRTKVSEMRVVSTNDTKQFDMAGYKKLPNETVAGKECEVWSHPSTKFTFWRWKGIDLKYTYGDKVAKLEATEVVTPATIPPEAMALPSE